MSRIFHLRAISAACSLGLLGVIPIAGTGNLIDDPSFEITKPKDQAGNLFAKWGGWRFEGDCGVAVGTIPHSGKTSALLYCNSIGKFRLSQTHDLQPGRYLITAYIRGVDIGTGNYNFSTEFMFNEKYMSLGKTETFGWTRMTYAAEITKAGKTNLAFGLWGPGYFWIDDVSLELVNSDVKLTDTPVLGNEESPVRAPGPLGPGAVRCPRCRYRNMPRWKTCYACGELLTEEQHELTGPPRKLITSFEQGNPFRGGSVVTEHATDGSRSLRIDSQQIAWSENQDWSGYDYLKIDTWTEARDPIPLVIEIQDKGTTDYFSRVNYNAVAPPGKSTLVLPLKQLFVGERGHPGRNLILDGVTKFVITAMPATPSPLYIDNFRLERETESAKAFFEGLQTFDFGPGDSPVMDGFTPVTPTTLYNPGKGYGLKDAKIWQAINAQQPDPLYQDYLCIESGGFAMDIPNGTWRVVVNVDASAGFWGQPQIYRERSIWAQGKRVVMESQSFPTFQKKYYTFWDKDDLPSDNTFDKYDRAHFSEKTFDVPVINGQLYLEFRGSEWANSVSSVIAFPVEKAAEGAHFLDYLKERRRFYFDNGFKRVLHRAAGDPLQPTAEETRQGLVYFQRDLMKDIYYNDTPFRPETGKPISGDAFPGEIVSLIAGVVPLKDFGRVHVAISDLVGAGTSIPATAIETGYSSYRVTRSTADGAVYTILPRWILPKSDVDLPKNLTRAFWFTVHTPEQAIPGVYKGKIELTSTGNGAVSIPVEFRVRKGSLDPADIPIGPFGGVIRSAWFADDPAAQKFSEDLTNRSLRLMRAYGFTMFSGLPVIPYSVEAGQPKLHFYEADRQMRELKSLGFLAMHTYGGGIIGIDPYHQDLQKMRDSRYSDYTHFIHAVYSKVMQHASDNGWIPVYWNLGDEPGGEELKGSIANAEVYRTAFPKGPPFFTIPTSLNAGRDANDPNFVLAKTITVPALGEYTEAGIKMLQQQGGDWATYNGASRWTYGTHLYKAVTEFGARFRIAWHWNIVAGDPYYALDCREDDFAWANSAPTGQLAPSIEFLRIAAGLNDYRGLLTVARLARIKAGTPAAQAAERLIASRMAAFHLDDKDHDTRFGLDDWEIFRHKLWDAIEALQ